MKQIKLAATAKSTVRKSEVKHLRKAGLVPCVLYGEGLENKVFTIELKSLLKVINTKYSYVFNIELDGKVYDATMHDIQFHPVTDAPLHVDFLAVNEAKPIVVDLPIQIIGHSEGIKQGGKLLIYKRKVRVSGLVDKLPEILDIDITPLKLGHQFTAGDLSYDNVTILTPKTTAICAVRHTRAISLDDVTTDAAEAETTEGEATEGAEAPAAEAK